MARVDVQRAQLHQKRVSTVSIRHETLALEPDSSFADYKSLMRSLGSCALRPGIDMVGQWRPPFHAHHSPHRTHISNRGTFLPRSLGPSWVLAKTNNIH